MVGAAFVLNPCATLCSGCVARARTCFHLQAEVLHDHHIRAGRVAEAHVLQPQLTNTLGRLLTSSIICNV